MAKRNKRATGHWLLDGEAAIFFRSGEIISHARVLDKSFRVQTSDVKPTVTVKTEYIKSIVYQSVGYPTDVLRTLGASEFHGDILNDPIRVEAAELGGAVSIPKARLISIVW